MRHVGVYYQKPELGSALANAVNATEGYMATDVSKQSHAQAVKSLLEDDVNIIQTDEFHIRCILSSQIGNLTGARVLAHAQGWDDYTNDHGLYPMSKELLIKSLALIGSHSADSVYTVSEACGRELPYDVDGCLLPIFDVDKYAVDEPSFQESPTNLLTVTNLRYPQKLRGVVRILRSLGPIFDSNPELTYSVVGGGTEFDKLSEWLSSYPHRDRVELLGTQENIPRYLDSADLFIYASELDSLGRVILEAQSAGLPVVAAGDGGIPEAVGDGGISCEMNIGDIRENIQMLLNDATKREEYSTAAKNRMEMYTEQRLKEHIDVWESILQ